VLGNGEAALVLEVEEIIRTALSLAPAARLPQPEQSRKRILVTDDSITSRTLLHNILESAGYVVETAVDGIDAFSRLRRAPFDLVLSDVDMPRLHGIGLTEKIRADPNLAAVPIILITSLDSPEDRERGLEAGANAYLVKRSFEESNLLDTVRNLL
jgi:two-component system chemotaxis sensor kinase CheA